MDLDIKLSHQIIEYLYFRYVFEEYIEEKPRTIVRLDTKEMAMIEKAYYEIDNKLH